jgi:hypothetical protein
METGKKHISLIKTPQSQLPSHLNPNNSSNLNNSNNLNNNNLTLITLRTLTILKALKSLTSHINLELGIDDCHV